MKSPVEALQQLREEVVFNRRKLADQLESIQNVQAEIEAIDRAIADEEALAAKVEAPQRPVWPLDNGPTEVA